jgi:ABC-type polysaccharide transport system permease subunit
MAKTSTINRTVSNRFLTAMKKYWQLYLLLLPAAVLLVWFRYMPMGGLLLAFKDYSIRGGFLSGPWVGLDNFRDFFSYFRFPQLVSNTLVLSLYKIAASFPLPIMLAISLNELRNNKVKRVVQTATYAPYFISVVIVVGIAMQLLATHTGLINNILALFGGERVNFLSKPGSFRHVFVITDIWQATGYTAILYIASLASVDPSLYEAAGIDGANRWKKIWYIDLPNIVPTATILFILEAGRVMDLSFEKVILLQNPANLVSSEVLTTYIYKMGITEGRFDFAAAGTMFNSVVNLALILTVNKIARKVGDEGLW